MQSFLNVASVVLDVVQIIVCVSLIGMLLRKK